MQKGQVGKRENQFFLVPTLYKLPIVMGLRRGVVMASALQVLQEIWMEMQVIIFQASKMQLGIIEFISLHWRVNASQIKTILAMGLSLYPLSPLIASMVIVKPLP